MGFVRGNKSQGCNGNTILRGQSEKRANLCDSNNPTRVFIWMITSRYLGQNLLKMFWSIRKFKNNSSRDEGV